MAGPMLGILGGLHGVPIGLRRDLSKWVVTLRPTEFHEVLLGMLFSVRGLTDELAEEGVEAVC